jgi:SAM-dependent methyltransferase
VHTNPLRALAQKYIPLATRRKLARLTSWPPVGWVSFGSFRRLKPINEFWGMERGQPIDRYYIEKFLAQNKEEIHGRVLEIGDNIYTVKFGENRVTQSDVLHIAEQRPHVTIIGDLTQADYIPSESFDCIILTQTLNAIFDVPAAVRTVYRILKPGGIVLVTVPGISKISRYDMDRWGYFWSFTTKSIRRLFETAFPAENLTVEVHGNVLAAVSFLHGLAAEDLRTKELEHHDPDYELTITLRAVKPAS